MLGGQPAAISLFICEHACRLSLFAGDSFLSFRDATDVFISSTPTSLCRQPLPRGRADQDFHSWSLMRYFSTRREGVRCPRVPLYLTAIFSLSRASRRASMSCLSSRAQMYSQTRDWRPSRPLSAKTSPTRVSVSVSLTNMQRKTLLRQPTHSSRKLSPRRGRHHQRQSRDCRTR